MKRFNSYTLSIALSVLFLALPFTLIHAQFIWQKTASVDSFPSTKFLSVGEELFVSMYGAGVYKTADEGKNWTACHNGLSSYFTRDLVTDSNAIFVATRKKGVLKSLDRGQSWQAANDTLLHLDIWSLLATGGRILAGTSNGIFYTDDSGESWQKATLPRLKSTHQIISALATKGRTLMAGSSGYVYLSEDLGQTWQEVNIPSHFEVKNITVQNDLWLIGTSGDGIFASTDGVKWTSWNKEAENTRSLLLVDDSIILGLSTQGIIKDASSMNEGLTNPAIRSLGYHQGKLYAGTYRQGIWRYDIPKADYTPSPTTSRQLWQAVNLYPNPVHNGLVTIEYQLEETTNVSIQLYDSFGQQIAPITHVQGQSKGHYQVNHQMNGLTDGTYYFHLSLGERSITKPIVLIK